LAEVVIFAVPTDFLGGMRQEVYGMIPQTCCEVVG
jgi:hypothetical protein